MAVPLYTPVTVSAMPFRLDMDCGVVSLGSCFADEVGRRMQQGGFAVELNPFGTVYNPASVAASVDRLVADSEITAADLVQHEGLWHSWHHHGSFSRPTATETLELCNSRLHKAHRALREARLLMVTFGTAWVFEYVGRQAHAPSIVANCHKLPASVFSRRMMTVDEIVALWQPLLQRLAGLNAGLHIVFSVSPIRHMADGAHGNQLSKSTLLLSVERLACQQHPLPVSYFPAYEIVLDELRDYRFYGPDMVHPSPLAADIVYDRFQQACMTPATIQQAHNNAKQHRREQHIPMWCAG